MKNILLQSLAIASIFTAITCASAQPGEPPPPREPRQQGRPSPDGPPNAPRLREFIDIQLERVRRLESRLMEAQRHLDDGVAPERIREMLREEGVDPDGRRNGPLRGEGNNEPRPDRGDAPPPPPRLSEEEQLSLLKEIAPEIHERFTALAERDPEAAATLLKNNRHRLQGLAEQRRRNPDAWPERREMVRLEMAANEAARNIAAMPEADRENAIERLRAMINRQFDLRMKFLKQDLERVEKRREHLQREIEKASTSRDSLIEDRIQHMLENAPPPRGLGGDNDDRPGRHPRRGPEGRGGPSGPGGEGGPGGPGGPHGENREPPPPPRDPAAD